MGNENIAADSQIEVFERYFEEAEAAGCPRDQVEGFANRGYVAQPVQLPFHALCRLADKEDGPTRIGMGGSRGGSKSHAIMAQMGDDCLRMRGLNVLYLRKLQKSAGESAENLIRKVFVGCDYSYAESRGRLVFNDTGSKILIGGFKDDSDIDKYIGIEYDLICLEEATQLSEKKVELLLGSCRTARDDWRARAYFSANPGGIGHKWYVERFVKPERAGTAKNWRYVHMNYQDNVFIKQGYRDYLGELTGGLKAMWEEGNWDRFEGMALPMLNHSQHTYNPVTTRLPAWWPRWRAVDWGFHSPFGCGWFCLDPDISRIYWYKEVYESGLTDRDQARLIFASSAHMIDLTYADPAMWTRKSRGAITFSSADEYATNGVPLTRANNDPDDGLTRVMRHLGYLADGKPGLLISTQCPHAWRTLTTLPLDPHTPTRAYKKGEDHLYDVLRYALTSKRDTQKDEHKRSTEEFYYEMNNPHMEMIL